MTRSGHCNHRGDMFIRRTNKSTQIHTRVFASVGLLLMLVAQAAVCKERPWYRYESTYFVANSNASEKKTLAILTNLELFRAAVLQVANLRVPESAVKTEILIVRSKKEFTALAGGRNSAGFALHNGRQFLIVMPSSGPSSWAKTVVRHEYSHVLLGYRNFQYPQWYNEGFAELLSTIRFRNKNTEYVFGEAPTRIEYATGGDFDWNTLISEGFDIHSMSGMKASGAYKQSWLLAHYVTLGDDFGNRPKLLNYFQMIAGGEPSLPAFERAFGMDGNDLWTRELRPYSKRLFSLVYNFGSVTLHTDFQRSDSDTAAVESLLDQLRTRATTSKGN